MARTCSRGFAWLLVALTLLAACDAGGSKTKHYWQGKPPSQQVSLPSLPAPLAMPAGGGDAAAAALATTVLAGGDQALPALVTAVRASGFAIRQPDGSLDPPLAEPAQNIVFYAWELTAMQKGVHLLTPMPDFAASLSTPKLMSGAPVADMLLAGIRKHADDQSPGLRFWARFIVELGRQRAVPNDALSVATVIVDGLQAAFILRRLVGDLYGVKKGAQAARPPGLVIDALAADGAQQCRLTEAEEAWITGGTVGANVGFDQLMEYVAKKGSHTAEHVAQVAAVVNNVLVYAKLLYLYMHLTADIRLEGEPPLVRTKKAKPATGERRTLTAHVKLDIGNTQVINCIRLALAMGGLDLDVPNDGSLEGVPVSWTLARGGGPGGFVQFHGSDIEHATTDHHGDTNADIEGIGQKQDIPETAKPYQRTAQIELEVAIKAANMVRDIEEGGGAGLAGPAGLWTVPAEMLQRFKWFVAGSLDLPVRDWSLGDLKLEFNSQISRIMGATSEKGVVKATFSIPYVSADGKTVEFGPADGQLEYVSYEWSDPPCARMGRGQGGTFHVAWVHQDVASSELSMLYDPGSTVETHILNCPGVDIHELTNPYWSVAYGILHQTEKQGGGYLATGWSPPPPGSDPNLVATREWRNQVSCNNATCLETTVMTLTRENVQG